MIQFLAALAILHLDDLKKRIVLVQFILFFKSSWCTIASTAMNLINSVPQTAFAFASVFILILTVKVFLLVFYIFTVRTRPVTVDRVVSISHSL